MRTDHSRTPRRDVDRREGRLPRHPFRDRAPCFQVTRTLQDGNVDAREGTEAPANLSSRANREKVTLAIGDKAANKLFDEVDRIATSFELRAGVAENSKTFARQAVSGRIDEMTAPGVTGNDRAANPLRQASGLCSF